MDANHAFGQDTQYYLPTVLGPSKKKGSNWICIILFEVKKNKSHSKLNSHYLHFLWQRQKEPFKCPFMTSYFDFAFS